MSGEVEEIKRKINIVDLIGASVQLRRQGKNHVGLCPFHSEKTPSFNVSEERQSFRCFGCEASGDIFAFVMRQRGLEFRDALKLLAEQCGVQLDTRPPSRGAEKARRKREQLIGLLDRVARRYRALLAEAPARRARAFLDRRGLTDRQVQDFALGFAPSGNVVLKEFAEELPLLLEVGLVGRSRDAAEEAKGKGESVRAGEHYDFFRNRLMFPIHNNSGQTVAFAGRRLDEGPAKYINSPASPVFEKRKIVYGAHRLRASGRAPGPILVVEGYLDVMALAQFDFDNAVAVMGTALSREAGTDLFRRSAGQDLIFCFDGDEAGRRAAARAVQEIAPILDDRRQIRLSFLPAGEDPDSLLRKQGRDAFSACLDQALTLSQYLLEKIPEGDTAESRARALQQVRPVLEALPESPYRQMLDRDLAKRCGLEGSLLRQRQRAQTRRTASSPLWQDVPESGPPGHSIPPWQDSEIPPGEDFDSQPRQAADSRPQRRKKDNLQLPVLNLLARLQLYPQVAAGLHLPDALRQGEMPDALSLVLRVLDALKANAKEGKVSWERALGSVLTREDAPESWEAWVKQAGSLVRGSAERPDTDERAQRVAQQIVLELAESCAEDPLRMWVDALDAGALSPQQRRKLRTRLNALQYRLAGEGKTLAEWQSSALQRLKGAEKH